MTQEEIENLEISINIKKFNQDSESTPLLTHTQTNPPDSMGFTGEFHPIKRNRAFSDLATSFIKVLH